MADQLSKIGALTEKLAGLGAKTRGMSIEADDWNALVAVLQGILEVDRQQEDQRQAQLAQNFAPLEHEHLGDVTSAWLDADLQAKVGTSSAGTNVLLRLSQIEAQLASINHGMARLSALTDAQQGALDRFAVNDLNRAKSVRDFDARIGTLDGIQTMVGAVTTDLSSIKGNLRTVLELRQTLTGPDGAPLDVAGLQQQVKDLAVLRDNLKGVDGTVLRLSDLELRVRDVENVSGVGTAGGLDARIAVAAAGVETRLRRDADTRFATLHDQLRAESTERATALKQDVEATLDTRLADAGRTNRAMLDETAGQLRAEANAQTATAIAAAQREQADATRALVAEQVGAVPAQIDAALAGARPGLEQAARDAAAAQVSGAIEAALPVVEVRFMDRLSALQTQVQQGQTAAETRLRTELDTALATMGRDTDTTLSTRFEALQQAVATGVTSQVASAVSGALPGITASAHAAIDQRLADLDTRVARAVADGTRSLPDTVGSEVQLQLARLDVGGQIAAATTQLTQQFRTELSTAASAQQDRTTTALSAAMTQLRGETTAAVKAGSDDAFSRAASLVGSARGELAQGVADLRTELRGEINTATDRVSTDFRSQIAQLNQGTVVRTRPDIVVRQPVNR